VVLITDDLNRTKYPKSAFNEESDISGDDDLDKSKSKTKVEDVVRQNLKMKEPAEGKKTAVESKDKEKVDEEIEKKQVEEKEKPKPETKEEEPKPETKEEEPKQETKEEEPVEEKPKPKKKKLTFRERIQMLRNRKKSSLS